jgi:hypothetical protein
MAKWIVTEVIEFTQTIEADSKEQALDYYIQTESNTKCIKFTAKRIKKSEN